MLVNDHTLSAGEMVAAFAQENGLARIVGSQTGGQVLGGGNFHRRAGLRASVSCRRLVRRGWEGVEVLLSAELEHDRHFQPAQNRFKETSGSSLPDEFSLRRFGLPKEMPALPLCPSMIASIKGSSTTTAACH